MKSSSVGAGAVAGGIAHDGCDLLVVGSETGLHVLRDRVGRGAASLSATRGAEDVDVVVAVAVDGESSAPQALNAKLASASSAMLARRLSLLMSASGFVKASAVSNPFKK